MSPRRPRRADCRDQSTLQGPPDTAACVWGQGGVPQARRWPLLGHHAESTPLKGELAVCCATLRTVVHEVRTLAEVEDNEKQQARVRLLKVIKAQMGPSGDDAQVMAALLTAEREGSSLYAEQLKVRRALPPVSDSHH